VGMVVEAEAYAGPEDRASHARFGPRSRATTMFGAPGRAYVYGVYGMHTCLNVVTGPAGLAAAILIRSVVPIEGIGSMRAARLARAIATRRMAAANPHAEHARIACLPAALVAAGPANLAAAFDVQLADDGLDLLDPASPLRLEAGSLDGTTRAIIAAARIGVAYAGPGWVDRPWRFVATQAPTPSPDKLA